MLSALLLLSPSAVTSHGHMVLPTSTRMGGSLAKGGDCTNGACFWFSNNVEIPGSATIPQELQSMQLNVTQGSEADVFKTSPWRAPGTAPVFGRGCGVAGGDSEMYLNGGTAPKGVAQGFDGVDMPAQEPVTWTRGQKVEVAWAISANHGGGYSYRLCKNDGNVSEECFQRTPMKFAGEQSYIIHADGTRGDPFPMAKFVDSKGVEWARDPIPGCYICDAYSKCGSPLPPVAGTSKDAYIWNNQVDCYAACDGSSSSKGTGACPEGTPQFEALAGYGGFGKSIWEWSVADMMLVPDDIEAGDYLLSWRWDCEESTQVWQNCADIRIV